MPSLNFFVSFFFQEKKEKDKTATGLRIKVLIKMRVFLFFKKNYPFHVTILPFHSNLYKRVNCKHAGDRVNRRENNAKGKGWPTGRPGRTVRTLQRADVQLFPKAVV